MMRAAVLLASALGVGVTFLLAGSIRFRHRPIAARLRPYAAIARVPGDAPVRPAIRLDSVTGAFGSLVAELGARLARITATRDGLAGHLARIGSDDTPASVRARQVVWGLAGLLMGTAAGATLQVPPVLTAVAVVAPAAVAVMWCEHRIREASAAWQRRLADELPVVAEQLGMLLGSGYSLGAALQRIAERGRGVAATGVASVLTRVRHGIDEVEALREWAARAQVPALDHLVTVLALNWEANDLGTLISAEARAMRRSAQRARIERIERRGQQVWIPVTVATLLPGVIFMAVPFVDAMGRLTGR